MTAIFWISLIFLVYVYGLYPLAMYVWANVFPRRVRKRYHNRPLSVVLVAGQASVTRESLTNLLDQDYPSHLVEVIVVADGAGDNVASTIKGMNEPRIRILHSRESMGRAWAINTGVQDASNDIVIIVTAGHSLSENALAELTAVFEDRNVGAVTGELVTTGGGSETVAIGPHREYENFILHMESGVDSVFGANGSIYAIRKQLFTPMPTETVLDDFVLLTRVVHKGFRAVFARSVRVSAPPSSRDSSQEFASAVRALAGNLQALAMDRNILHPARNRLFFQMVSHRFTRLLAPYFLIATLVSNLFVEGVFFKATLAAQFLFYASVLLRFTPLIATPLGGFIRTVWAFTVLNIAAVMGLWTFLIAKNNVAWNRGGTSSGLSHPQ